MRHSIAVLAAGLSLAALSAPAAAQEAPDYESDYAASAEEGDTTRALGDLKEQLGDPVRQQQLAGMLAAMSHALLDLPLAPLAKAIADAGGEAAADVRPDATLRNIAPGADEVPEVIARELPRAMGAMSSMAGGIEAMAPALADLAARMKDIVANADLQRD